MDPKRQLRSLEHRWWWQKHPFIVVGILIILFLVIAFTVAVLIVGWNWTGFNEHIGPNVQQYQPAKTLWDWLNLLGVLAIPAVVGLGAAWYTAQQGKASDKENTDNQRETALQTYVDKMSELILDKNLRGSGEKDEVRNIARVRTLTILRRLDEKRKGIVLQFLYESGLIEKETRIVVLRGADLRDADLYGADLRGAHLGGADLRDADLRRADLEGITVDDEKMTFSAQEGGYIRTDLRGANLSHANLGRADLRLALVDGTDFSGANLAGADLEGMDLSGTDLHDTSFRGANLYEANITPEQKKVAGSFRHATMPEGPRQQKSIINEKDGSTSE